MRLRHASLVVPCQGESVSGDAVCVREEGARTLVAIVDALGHGPGAAEVADKSVAFLRATPTWVDAERCMEGLHGALRGTRGAGAMVCVIEGDTLQGCGVGNVELRLTSSHVPVVLSPGILGAQVRRLRSFTGKVAPGDRLILFSDGVSARFAMAETRALPPQAAAQSILDRWRRPTDDSSVLVADLEA
jgi:negative regulator of sigma-B (phosphoserine phosphatase)